MTHRLYYRGHGLYHLHNHFIQAITVLTDSAESYFNQALSTYESLYGSSHEKSLEITDELSRLMIRTDRVQVSFINILYTIV